MTRPFGLLVTDASPLITLAAGEALECLTMPGLRVVIPDMVYFEVTQDMARTGAEAIVRWARRHAGQVEIVVTSVFAEYQVVRVADPTARSRGRGELSALEILNDAIDGDPELEAMLLFEDNDVRTRRFIRALPERVSAISTGDLLRELEVAGLIPSANQILDRAVAHERNVARQRTPEADDLARNVVRQHLQRPAPQGCEPP